MATLYDADGKPHDVPINDKLVDSVGVMEYGGHMHDTMLRTIANYREQVDNLTIEKNNALKRIERLNQIKQEKIEFKKIKEMGNICSETFNAWQGCFIATMLIASIFFAVLLSNSGLGALALIGTLMMIPVGLFGIREYVRHNFRVNGRRAD